MLDIISGLGSVAGSALGAWSQHQANKQNLKIAREQNQFNERMARNAVQYRREDLEKAKINPMLAAGSAASSPGAAGATMQPIFSGDAGVNAVNSALSGYSARNRKEMQNAQMQQLEYQNKLTAANASSALESVRTQQTQQQSNIASANAANANAALSAWHARILGQKYSQGVLPTAQALGAYRKYLEYPDFSDNAAMYRGLPASSFIPGLVNTIGDKLHSAYSYYFSRKGK